jgi:hypothetical protein
MNYYSDAFLYGNVEGIYPVPFFISLATCSDARMDTAKIVMVGFCHPQVTKQAPSTTSRFLISCVWFHRFSTLFFRIVPHARGAHFVNAVPRRIELVGLGNDIPPGGREDLLHGVGRVLRHIVFVIAVLDGDVQHRDALRFVTSWLMRT